MNLRREWDNTQKARGTGRVALIRAGLAAAGLGIALLASASPCAAQNVSGRVSPEFRGFFTRPERPEQPRASVSLAIEPEFSMKSGGHDFRIVPFFRLDSADAERTHFDVREALWRTGRRNWELRAGVGKVFWGVTESQHLVDVINQTDFVENIDTEDKLGQPMAVLTLMPRWGNIEIFLLPGFRQRTFPGQNGRLRFPLRVATELAEFESPFGKRHVDAALRWSGHAGAWDIGLSHFRGTTRDPLFSIGVDANGESVLIPRYDLIDQTGLDLQATSGGWLWKLEAISRGGQGSRFNAATGGFEYTFGNVWRTGLDLGLLAEYLFDSRGRLANTPFEDDVFLGMRFEFNDVQTTQMLAGTIVDRKTGAVFASVEASRRLGDRWRLNLEARLFVGLPPTDYLYGFRNDDHVQLEFSWYF
jgi:hypothetical protein